MNCRQVVELMTDYLDGALSAGDRARFEEHMAGCDGCRAYLAQLRTTRESFGQHLELVEAIDPKSWNPTDLHKELSRALSTVEDARTEFSQQRSRLQAADENSNDVALPETASDVAHLLNGSRSFGQWAKIGFAFSLPLMIFAFIAFLLIFWLTSKGL